MTANTAGVHPPASSGRYARRLGGALAALLLGACASGSVPLPVADEAAIQRYREGGYPMPPAAALQTRRISAPLTEASWSVSLTRTADATAHPVIVLLPSLGEDDTAPVRWIGSWARAGYAVLTIQPLAEDADAWATADARSGDFARVARARFAPELMPERIAQLVRRLAEVHARSQRGETGLEALDWTRVVLAGADLGAYTVETTLQADAALQAPGWTLTPLAYIVINPYARRSGDAGAAPARPAHAPVLMISARDDVDAYGLVTDATQRRQAFDRLGPGEAWYLELGAVSHRWLAGEMLSTAGAEGPHRPPGPVRADGDGPERRRKGPLAVPGAAGARDSMAPEGEDEDGPVDKKAMQAARLEMAAARSRALTHAGLSVASFEAVSLAFLDATVRQQPAARAWLGESAGKWLQDGDRLKHR